MNRIEGTPEELIARMQAEGANSPADILLTVDAGRIWLADQEGLLQPVDSEVLNERIPAHLRHPDGHWFGFSQRARMIFYAKDRVANPPQTYEALADPAYEGRICIRSSSNVYNLSLMAAMIANDGEEAARRPGRPGLLANLARAPEGGDIDQIKGVVSRRVRHRRRQHLLFRAGDREPGAGRLSAELDNIGWVFPNQETSGAHVNIAAAGRGGERAASGRGDQLPRVPDALRRRRPISPTRTTSIPAVEGAEVGEIPASLGGVQGRHAELRRARREPAAGAADLQRDRLSLTGRRSACGSRLRRPKVYADLLDLACVWNAYGSRWVVRRRT